MKDHFYKRYFSEAKTNLLTQQILTFKQKEDESLFACWERYKDLLLSIPHHGFVMHQKVSFFVIGCNKETQKLIDTVCKPGEFLDQTPEQAWDYLEKLAERS